MSRTGTYEGKETESQVGAQESNEREQEKGQPRPGTAKSTFLQLQGGGYFMAFFLPPKYTPVSRDFFFSRDDEMSSHPYPPPHNKKERGSGGGRGKEGGGHATPSLHITPAPPFPPSLPFSSRFPSLPLSPKKVGRPQRKPKKSSLAPILACDQHLFCSRRTHSPPYVTWSPSQSDRSRRRRRREEGGGSRTGPSSRTPWASRGAGGDRPI